MSCVEQINPSNPRGQTGGRWNLLTKYALFGVKSETMGWAKGAFSAVTPGPASAFRARPSSCTQLRVSLQRRGSQRPALSSPLPRPVSRPVTDPPWWLRLRVPCAPLPSAVLSGELPASQVGRAREEQDRGRSGPLRNSTSRGSLA